MINHITDLLYKHDCVVLPEFGAFVVNTESAVIDHVMGQIHPPARKVVFNALIKANDGLLIDHVSRKEHVAYESAASMVQHFIDEIQSQLKQSQVFSLPGIGKFTMNIERKYEFSAEPHNFDLGCYGLAALNFYPILRGAYTSPNAIPQVDKRKKLPFSLASATKVASVLLLAVIIPLLLNAIFKGLPEQQESSMAPKLSQQTEEEGKSKADKSDDETISAETSAETPINLQNDRPHDGQLAAEPDDDEAEIVKPKTDFNDTENKKMVESYMASETSEQVYIMIIGSFGDAANAKKLSQKLIKDGYTPYTDVNKGLNRVGVRMLCPAKDLEKALEKVRKSYNPKAWVLNK